MGMYAPVLMMLLGQLGMMILRSVIRMKIPRVRSNRVIGHEWYHQALSVGTVVVMFTLIVLLPRLDWSARATPLDVLQTSLRFHHCVAHGDYSRALEYADTVIRDSDTRHHSPVLVHDVHLALYKTGRLMEELLMWPHKSYILLPDLFYKHASTFEMERKIDIVTRLGRINDAERLSYELMAITGGRYHPELFWHLCKIHSVKNEPEIAMIYLRHLARDRIHRERALKFMHSLEDDGVHPESMRIEDLRARMQVFDDVQETIVSLDEQSGRVGIKNHRKLENLLQSNPGNNMALEFLVGSYLINGNTAGVAQNAYRFAAAGYAQIPDRVQEALVIYRIQGGEFDRSLAQMVSPDTVARFRRFSSVAQYYSRQPGAASHESMKEFQETYWYYLWLHSAG